MKISGLMKLTLLDFPGKTACTVFTSGCNYRCPFCHNASLVRGEEGIIPEEEFFSFLSKRKGLLDGVAITGGEPLLQPDLEDFSQRIREMGFLIKLDTNGSFPDRLQRLINLGLIDYVAMDVKSSHEGYARVTGVIADTDKIGASIELLKNGNTDYEFRTTAAKGLVFPEDFDSIAQWIAGAKRYFIQGYVDSGDILGSGASAYTKEEMEYLLSRVKPFVPAAELRGI